MSNYPVWWDTTITVYNKDVNAVTGITTWYRHTVTNCYWQYRESKLKIDNVTLEASGVICRIPEDFMFIEKYAWAALTNERKASFFTLGVGDIIVKGEVSDTIDELTKGHRSTDVINKYKDLQGVMIIDSVQINVGAGRGNPHYHVRGV